MLPPVSIEDCSASQHEREQEAPTMKEVRGTGPYGDASFCRCSSPSDWQEYGCWLDTQVWRPPLAVNDPTELGGPASSDPASLAREVWRPDPVRWAGSGSRACLGGVVGRLRLDMAGRRVAQLRLSCFPAMLRQPTPGVRTQTRGWSARPWTSAAVVSPPVLGLSGWTTKAVPTGSPGPAPARSLLLCERPGVISTRSQTGAHDAAPSRWTRCLVRSGG